MSAEKTNEPVENATETHVDARTNDESQFEHPAQNTDRELWREREGDYNADSIHVTQDGKIGMNCGGMVIVLSIRKWHEIAKRFIGMGI